MRTTVTLLATIAAVAALAAPATAEAARGAQPGDTTLTMEVPTGRADTSRTLRVALTLADETAVPGASVQVQRRVDGAWRSAAEVVTGENGVGKVRVRLSRVRVDNVFRARYAGDATHQASRAARQQAVLVRRDSRVRLDVPRSVVDERRLTATVRWTTGNGTPVPGSAVRIERRNDGKWRTVERLITDDDGLASVRLRPRQDVVLRARTAQRPWVAADLSGPHRIDNLPPAPPVDLPAAAPAPRRTPPGQARPDVKGPHVVVSRIPDGVWRSMVGRTWHAGCPVGRAGLRLIRANYFDFGGYRRRGELIVAAGATDQFAGALRALYRARIPMRSMYRVDRFGWSKRVRGGDDYASMAAGNTSAFNCRDVVGRPGVRSPHSYGRAFDLNTWENPYHSAQGVVPNRWWAGRSHPRVAWRSGRHQVVKIMRAHGFAWTYGTHDSQHFDARTARGTILARCATVCH